MDRGRRRSTLNVLANAYPVLIQRYNRIRLLRLFDLGPDVPGVSTAVSPPSPPR